MKIDWGFVVVEPNNLLKIPAIQKYGCYSHAYSPVSK